jgi:hypothetical protein
MPLNASNFVPTGHLTHQDVGQFYDLLTGVMSDQPVSINNNLSVAGAAAINGAGGLTIGTPNERLVHRLGLPSVHLESTDGYVLNGALQQVFFSTNAYYDGSNWQRWNTGRPSTSFSMADANFRYLTQAAGTGTIGWGFTALQCDTAGNLSIGGAYSGNGAVPSGGAAGQVLAKNSATNYDVAWVAAGTGGLTIPLTQTLTFSPDTTYDIGASGANRPRDLWLGRNLIVSGTSQLQGNVGIGTTPQGYAVLLVASTAPVGTTSIQNGLYVVPQFASAVTNYGVSAYIQFATANAAFTMASGYAVQIGTPSFGTGSSVSAMYGLYVNNQGAANASNAYGVYIAAQSGAGGNNLGLYNAGSSALVGNVGIGTNPATLYALSVAPPLGSFSGGINYTAARFAPSFPSSGTGTLSGLLVALTTQAASFTATALQGLGINTPSFGVGSAVTTSYGVNVANQGAAAVTNAYGVYIANQSGASSTNIGLYNAGSEQIMGNVGIGGAPLASSALRIGQSVPFTGFDQYALNINPFFSTAASDAYGVYVNLALGGTIPAVYGICVASPSTSATATNTYGVYVGGQGSPNTANAYGIYIAAQSGSSGVNIGLYNAGTSQLVGNVAIGNNATPPLIHPLAGAGNNNNLVVEAPGAGAFVEAKTAVYVMGNAYHDGTNWQRYDVAQPSIQLSVGYNGFIVNGAAAGANPISAWTTLLNLPAGGPLTIGPPGLTVNGGTVNFAGANVNPNLRNWQIGSGSAVSTVAGAWVDLPNTFTPDTSGLYIVLLEVAYTNGATAGVVQIGLASVPSTSGGTTLLVSALGYQSVPASAYAYLTMHAQVNLSAGTQYRQQAYCSVVGGNFTGRLMSALRIA